MMSSLIKFVRQLEAELRERAARRPAGDGVGPALLEVAQAINDVARRTFLI